MWKDISGYQGLYKVSDDGKVFSCRLGRIMSPNKISSGYYQYTFVKDGKRKQVLGHRLVAEAFIGNPKCLPCINHKNEIKTDNRAENLEWCTVSYNSTYGSMALFHKNAKYWGNGVEATKKPVEQIKNGIVIAEYDSISEANRNTGINISNISQCCKKNRQRAGNYEWRFKEE